MIPDARRIAECLGHRCVEPEHVLLNLVSAHKGGPAKRVLNQFGLTDRKFTALLRSRAA